MRSLILFIMIVSVLARSGYAHEGHNDHDGHGEIVNGEMIGTDGVVYLDAGASVEWGEQKLLRKITRNNQIIYQYIGAVSNNLNLTQKKELNLKIPGSEKLKGFSFNHAGDFPNSVQVILPNLSSQVEISKRNDFTILWSSTKTAAIVRIIIEVKSDSGDLRGRLTISTVDDGEFIIPSDLLEKLPSGKSQIAIKRIWVGGFYPEENHSKIIGIRTASSVVGKAIVVD